MNADKEKRAIQYLRTFESESEPYYLCYSGGKDSDVIRILAELAGVKYETHHNLTTVDAPETVYYVRSIPGVIIDRPKLSMWQLIVQKKMPPTRLARYCCAALKERNGKGKMKVTGVRWAESARRNANSGLLKVIGKQKSIQKLADENDVNYKVTKQGGLVMNDDNAVTRRFIEHCYRTTATTVNPIVDWEDGDVWEFLNHYGCKSNPLYQCGFSRIGCIGCPLASRKKRIKEFQLYPKYRLNYIRAFDRMLEARQKAGRISDKVYENDNWKDGESVMKWWLGEDLSQITLFDKTSSIGKDK